MDRARYIETLTSDGEALLAAATDLDAAVPMCPGWTARDAVLHTADVYADKMATIALRGEGEAEWPPDRPDDIDPVAYFRDTHARLLETFATMDDDAPATTWWPSENKAGLWVRRMAQETAVHRHDVQSATGVQTPIDPELAVDGVDEALALFPIGPWWDEDKWDGYTGTATVRTGGRAWHVQMLPRDMKVVESDEPADLVVSGEPSDVLLWLWGRVGDGAVTIEGDPSTLRERLKYTQ